MTTFRRAEWSQLWIQLTADEPLGILDSSYLEDFNGTDGQVSLLHVKTGTRHSVLMAPVPSDSQINFRGFILGNALANGKYAIQGRVRDLVGNLSIMGAVSTPAGGERILHLEFWLHNAIPGPSPHADGTLHDVRSGYVLISSKPGSLIALAKDEVLHGPPSEAVDGSEHDFTLVADARVPVRTCAEDEVLVDDRPPHVIKGDAQ